MQQDDNPYQSPCPVSATGVGCAGPLREGTKSTLLAKGWISRKVAVEAPIEAVIEFRGWELPTSVYVDGRFAAGKWTNVSVIEFTLNVDDKPLPVVVRHRPTLWFTLAAFHIEIDGKIVYSEGRWPAENHRGAAVGAAGLLLGFILSAPFLLANPKSYVIPGVALMALLGFLGFVAGRAVALHSQ